MAGFAIVCGVCGYGAKTSAILDYFCPRCQAFLAGLYRREHVEPWRAWAMTAAEIEAEYAAAGLAMRPLSEGERAEVRRSLSMVRGPK